MHLVTAIMNMYYEFLFIYINAKSIQNAKGAYSHEVNLFKIKSAEWSTNCIKSRFQ